MDPDLAQQLGTVAALRQVLLGDDLGRADLLSLRVLADVHFRETALS